MALTAGTIQTQIQRRTGVIAAQTNLNTVILDLIQDAIDELFSEFDWSWTRKVGQFTTEAAYETGTWSGSAGSTAITGSGTTFPSTGNQLYAKLSDKLYLVASRDSDTGLTLEAPLESAIAAGTAVALYQPWVSLASDVTQIVEVISDPHPPLESITLQNAEMMFMFWDISDWAQKYAIIPPDSSKNTRIGLYPMPTTRRTYSYFGFIKAPTISSTSTELLVPDELRGIIIEKTLYLWYTEQDHKPDLAQGHLQNYERRIRKARRKDTKAKGKHAIRGWTRTDSRVPKIFSSQDYIK